jgi:hypothetical protein
LRLTWRAAILTAPSIAEVFVRFFRLGLMFVCACVAGACNEDAPPTAPTPEATLVRMDIDGPTQRNIDQPGGTVQLRAIAQLSDGTRPDVTAEATWTVVNPGVLTVSRGLATGVAVGGTIVTATYRGWSSVTNVSVGPIGGPLVQVSGVVVDAERGAPLADADLTGGGFEDEVLVLARTDGNGFFNLGDRRGSLSFGVSKFGYEPASVNLTNLREPARLDIRLTPNPGAYIERTASGRFETPPSSTDQSRATLRLNTRAGGVFDAIVQTPSCAGSPGFRLTAASGGARFASGLGVCRTRLRFVVPASEITLTIAATGAPEWQLTYREPR